MCTALLLALSLLQAEPAPAPPAASAPDASAAANGTTSPTVNGDVPAAATDSAKAAPPDATKAEPQGAAAADASRPDPAAPAAAAPAADASPAPEGPKPEGTAAPTAAGESTAATGASASAPGAAAGLEGAAAVAAPIGSPPAAPAPAPEAAPAVAAPAPCPAVEAPKAPGLALIGYSFGVGFPEFGTGSLVVRPLDWLRVSGGVTWNYVGYGLRGGVTLAPIRWYVSPTLNLAAGRYLKMDATKAAKPPAEVSGLVSKVGYQYVDATLGLELGNQRHGMLVLQVGVTRIWLDAPGTATFDATASGGSTSTQTTVEATGVKLKGYGPAASLSWILFL